MAKQNRKKLADKGELTDKEKMMAELKFREIETRHHEYTTAYTTALIVVAAIVSVIFTLREFGFDKYFIIIALIMFSIVLTFFQNARIQYRIFIHDLYCGLYISIKNGTILDFELGEIGLLEKYTCYKRKYSNK
ncbi:MAG: hypothetical protein U9Q92_00215 [archaeon]|nr:hypothetical protein [archaeon]